MELADRTAAVRTGEELPVAPLAAYLQSVLHVSGDLTVEQFPGGHSNLTYLLKMGGHEWVLRRPPFGSKVKTAHDMAREHRVLSALSPTYPLAPKPVAHCEDESVIGARFYVMERVRGVVLRRKLPKGLDLTPPLAHDLSTALIDTLAGLHAIDPAKVGLSDFGKPDGYVERQVTGWTKRYQDSKTDDIPDIDAVALWLRDHIPESPTATIIHNDFKYDNLVLDESNLTRVVGILDWEMSTLGDPLMDLGTSLCYWVQADDPEFFRPYSFGPTWVEGSLSRRQLAERYEKTSGRRVTHLDFYYCFGLFKTAVVIQQIYYRYKQGLTTDERFALMIEMVKVLAAQAAASIGKDP